MPTNEAARCGTASTEWMTVYWCMLGAEPLVVRGEVGQPALGVGTAVGSAVRVMGTLTIINSLHLSTPLAMPMHGSH